MARNKAPIPDLREWAEKIGATIPTISWSYRVETRIGALLFTPYEGWIACRFEDMDKARAHFRASEPRFNLHSGKWNWTAAADPKSVAEMTRQFQQAVEELLPEPTASEPTLP